MKADPQERQPVFPGTVGPLTAADWSRIEAEADAAVAAKEATLAQAPPVPVDRYPCTAELIRRFAREAEEKSTGLHLWSGYTFLEGPTFAARYAAGWHQANSWGDGYYVVVLVHPGEQTVVTYCENDLKIAHSPDPEAFLRELAEAEQFYGRPLDPPLPPSA